jgi:hypothetical protein
MSEEREVFTIRLRALPGVDAIKAIRRLLKYALRVCRLRALSVFGDSVAEQMDESFSNAREGQEG